MEPEDWEADMVEVLVEVTLSELVTLEVGEVI